MRMNHENVSSRGSSFDERSVPERSVLSAEPHRILMVAVNWLGDILLMTPAIRAIRRRYPKSTIACLVPPRGLSLLEANPHLDFVIPLKEARGVRGILRWWPLIRILRPHRFDTVFLFHRSFSRALISWLSGIPNRIGFWTLKRGWLLTQSAPLPRRDSIHKSIFFLKLLEAVGIPPDGLHYDLNLAPEDLQAAKRLLQQWQVKDGQPLVAIHPGANWRLKRWPGDSFAQLADRLAQEHLAKVIFLGSQEDLPLVSRIVERMKTVPLLATGQLTLPQLGGLLTHVSLLISNDSGPLHLAHAVGTPVIGLFGPTDPAFTGPPPGDQVVSLFGSIGCPVPCYRLHCPVNLCMSQITVNQVLEAAVRFLGDAFRGRSKKGHTS